MDSTTDNTIDEQPQDTVSPMDYPEGAEWIAGTAGSGYGVNALPDGPMSEMFVSPSSRLQRACEIIGAYWLFGNFVVRSAYLNALAPFAIALGPTWLLAHCLRVDDWLGQVSDMAKVELDRRMEERFGGGGRV